MLIVQIGSVHERYLLIVVMYKTSYYSCSNFLNTKTIRLKPMNCDNSTNFNKLTTDNIFRNK